MSLEEKYAMADINAVKSFERAEGGFLKVCEMVSNREITPRVGARNLNITIEELKEKILLAGFKFPEGTNQAVEETVDIFSQ